MTPGRAIVIGGGIAGLCAAYFLRRRELDVTVIEAGQVGSGASSGNAGWICPAQSGPLPEPGLTTYGVKSIFDRDSALYIAPSQLARMSGWLAAFARHCNESDHARGTEALARLGRRSFALTEGFADDGIAFESYRQGMLVVAERRQNAEAFLHGLAPLRELDFEIPERTMSAAELGDREPMLSADACAGIFIGRHVHVRSETLLDGLATRLAAMGVEIERERPVRQVTATAREVTVATTAGSLAADVAVVAAGAWTAALCRPLGVRLPIAAGKGYSFEVDLPEGVRPRSAMLLLDAHVGCSPFSDRMRVAGTMEFSGLNDRIDHRRVDAIARGTARLLPSLDVDRRQNLWSGMRPIAPDGLPIVDRVPGSENVYVAGAYSMIGMTLAAPAGEALAEMVISGRRPSELEPFRIDRFRGGRRRSRRRSRAGARSSAASFATPRQRRSP